MNQLKLFLRSWLLQGGKESILCILGMVLFLPRIEHEFRRPLWLPAKDRSVSGSYNYC